MVKFISDELIIYLNPVVLASMDDGDLMVLLFIQKDLHYQKLAGMYLVLIVPYKSTIVSIFYEYVLNLWYYFVQL